MTADTAHITRGVFLVLLAPVAFFHGAAAGAVADPLATNKENMTECQISFDGAAFKADGVSATGSVKCSAPVVISSPLRIPGTTRGAGVSGCLFTVGQSTSIRIIRSTISHVGGEFPRSLGYGPRVVLNAALCVWDFAHVELVDSSIAGNSISGVVAGAHSTLVIKQSNVTDNYVAFTPSDGVRNLASGVSAVGDADVVIVDSLIRGNTRCFERTSSDYLFSDVQTLVRAMAPGGVLVGDHAQMRMGGITNVSDNVADVSCGGIRLTDQGRLVISDSSVIVANRVPSNGGGICASNRSRLVIEGRVLVSGNYCGVYGCGVVATGTSQVTIRESAVFLRNSMENTHIRNKQYWRCPSAYIGSVRLPQLIYGAGPDVMLKGPSIYGGGAIAALHSARVSIQGHVQLSSNQAYGRGGAIYSSGGQPGCDPAECRMPPVVNITGSSVLAENVAQSVGPAAVSDIAVDAAAVLLIGDNVVTSRLVPLTPCSDSVFVASGSFGVHNTTVGCAAGMFVVGDRCQCCAPYTYDFGERGRPSGHNDDKCMRYPSNAVCRENRVLPEPGFWHSSPKSVQLHMCPMGVAACNVSCNATNGYAGNLCGSCLRGWGMTSPFRCSKCLQAPLPMVLYLIFFACTVAIVSYTVHATWADCQKGGTSLRVSDLIKVPVQFVQYLVILGSIMAPWPAFLTNWFVVGSVVWGSGQTASVDCFVKQHFAGGRLPAAIQRQLVFMIAPLAVLAVVMLLVCVTHGIRLLRSAAAVKRTRRSVGMAVPALQLVSRLRVAILVVVFFAYPTLVKAALSFFACLPIDDTKNPEVPYPQYAIKDHAAGYWVFDINQECFTGWHKGWALGLGLPLVVVLCVGVPVAIWLLMWLKGNNPEPAFQQHFGFLYRNYVQGRRWWEAVWAVQTVLLTVVAVFNFSIGTLPALLLMGLFLALSIAMQIVFRPYAEVLLHRLHLASSCLLLVSVWLTQLMYSQQRNAMARQALGAILVIVDSVFVTWCVSRVVQLAWSTWAPESKALAPVKAWVQGLCGEKSLPRSHTASKSPAPAP